MPWFINQKGNLNYVGVDYEMSLTHGGIGSDAILRARLHKQEIEKICNEIVDKKIEAIISAVEDGMIKAINEYGRQIWSGLISSLEDTMTTEVTSEVKIAFDNAADIFFGSKAQTYVREKTMQAMRKELNKIRYIKIK